MKNIINYWAMLLTAIFIYIYFEGYIPTTVALPTLILSGVAYMMTQSEK